MNKTFVPVVVISGFLAYVALAASGPAPVRPGTFDFAAFGRLPVSMNGRVQPFDSVGRLGLQQIRGSIAVPLEPGEAKVYRQAALDVTQWLLEVLVKPDAADRRKIFPVEERALARKLSLEWADRGGNYYAFRDFAGKASDIGAQTQRVSRLKPADRSPWERELLALQGKLALYERLKNSVQPNSALQRDAKGRPVVFDFANELAKFRVDLSEASRVADKHHEDPRILLDRATELRLRAFSQLFLPVSRLAVLATVPPAQQPRDPRERWHNTGTVIVDGARGVRMNPAVAYLASVFAAFAGGQAEAFNDTVAKYAAWLSAHGLDREVNRAGNEAFYNAFRPFLGAIVVYAAGLVALVAAWRTRSATSYATAVLLMVLAFALHTTGLVFVIELAGRPSFGASVGWTLALGGLVVERFRRYAGLAASAAIALSVLVTAHALAPGGPAALLGALLDVRLLPAVLAAGIALGMAGGAGRLNEQAGMGWRDRLSSGYFAVRRALRAQ